MVGGQAIDLACVTPDPQGRTAPPLDRAGLAVMHAKKTGALIRASATSGAVLGGGGDAQVAAIDAAAAEFGLAFQIVDDILDVEGDAAQLGKSIGKDAAAGKPTCSRLVRDRRVPRDGRGMYRARQHVTRPGGPRRVVAPRHRPLDRRPAQLMAFVEADL